MEKKELLTACIVVRVETHMDEFGVRYNTKKIVFAEYCTPEYAYGVEAGLSIVEPPIKGRMHYRVYKVASYDYDRLRKKFGELYWQIEEYDGLSIALNRKYPRVPLCEIED